jgi:hypothetical protein
VSQSNQSVVSAFQPRNPAVATASMSPIHAPKTNDAKAQMNKTHAMKANMRRAYTTRGI